MYYTSEIKKKKKKRQQEVNKSNDISVSHWMDILYHTMEDREILWPLSPWDGRLLKVLPLPSSSSLFLHNSLLRPQEAGDVEERNGGGGDIMPFPLNWGFLLLQVLATLLEAQLGFLEQRPSDAMVNEKEGEEFMSGFNCEVVVVHELVVGGGLPKVRVGGELGAEVGSVEDNEGHRAKVHLVVLGQLTWKTVSNNL